MYEKNSKRRFITWTAAGALSVVGLASVSAVAFTGAASGCGSTADCGAPTAASPTAAAPAAADAKVPPAADAAAQSQVDAVAKSYLAVQTQLAADKADGVPAELKKLHDAAAALAEKAADDKVKAGATAVAKASEAPAKDLKQAREAFKPLSAAVIALVQLAPPTADASPALYQATCPMAKANWLQGTKEVVNPYMGAEMLACGEVQKKIEPAAAVKAVK